MKRIAMNDWIRKVGKVLLAGGILASMAITAVACRRGSTEFIPLTTVSPGTQITISGTGGEYTYRGYSTALGNNWNPHTWETSADSLIQSYTTAPLVALSIRDSQAGVYQWVYELATAIRDVTKDRKADLTKYSVTLPEGKTAETTDSGFVFEIKLNPRAKWEDGSKITAEDYLYSMQQILNPKMRNYRANLFYTGDSAVAGGAAYYNSEAPIYAAVVPAYSQGSTPDYSFDLTKQQVYIHPTSKEMTFASDSLGELAGNQTIDSVLYNNLLREANAYGYIPVTAKNRESILALLEQYCRAHGVSIYHPDGSVNEARFKEFLFYNTEKVSEKVEFDRVGCYKVDEYTIRYVTQTYLELNYFLTACTSTWLVKKDLYEANKNTTGELVTTAYGTSKATYSSCGPYKIQSIQTDKQIVFVRNENWYGWEKDEKGNLYSLTNFEVDGKRVRQYQTTRIVIDVMDEAAAKQAFWKGDLSQWTPTATELSAYSTSEQLYQMEETYTRSFFFNTNVDALKKMDQAKGNLNSVVLSNYHFRKAFSLAINRREFVTATAGYKPAFSLLNKLYYYDIYNDPSSSYRTTPQAMQAIVNLYGVEYGAGKAYATLQEAHDAITGYNLQEARKQMKIACNELVTAGVYTKGEEIKIRIGWAKGAMTADDNAQIVLLNQYLNAAMEGSGFGKIILEGIGNVNDRYAAVPAGEFAIGYGAWGGAWMYPFRNFQVYMDPDQNKVNELGCYDPKTELLTLQVNGKAVIKTWQEWSNSMVGSGEYTDADLETKLSILAQLEEAFLQTYYRIPLCSTTSCFLLSYQVNYYTSVYNVLYDFGGFRLLTYNLNDANWQQYVQSQGGTLQYE